MVRADHGWVVLDHKGAVAQPQLARDGVHHKTEDTWNTGGQLHQHARRQRRRHVRRGAAVLQRVGQGLVARVRQLVRLEDVGAALLAVHCACLLWRHSIWSND